MTTLSVLRGELISDCFIFVPSVFSWSKYKKGKIQPPKRNFRKGRKVEGKKNHQWS